VGGRRVEGNEEGKYETALRTMGLFRRGGVKIIRGDNISVPNEVKSRGIKLGREKRKGIDEADSMPGAGKTRREFGGGKSDKS